MTDFPRYLQRALDKVGVHLYQEHYGKEPLDFDTFLQAIATRIGERNIRKIKEIGHGYSGTVFWLSDRKKVLKVTSAQSDAYASSSVKRKPSRALVKTYDVFAATDDTTFYNLYFIVNEKLTPLAGPPFLKVERLINLVRRADDYISPVNMANYKKLREEVANREDLQEDFEDSDNLLDLYKSWAEALDAHRIIFNDLKTENVMLRGRDIVIADLGGTAPSTEIPSITD